MRRKKSVVRSRCLAVTLTAILLTAGCSLPASTPQGSSAVPNQVAFGVTQVDATIHALAQSGVGVYATVNDTSPIEKVSAPAVPLRFLKWQARDLALDAATVGGGLSGRDLDGLAPVPVDAVPASYLVAAYVKSASTAGGRYAQRLIGKQDWVHPESISFPTLVLVLLLADTAAAARPAAVSGATGEAHAPIAVLAAFNVAGLCQTLANWVNQAFDDLFNLIKVGPSTNPLLSFLGTLWNIGVNLVENGVKAAIAAFTAPVADLIRTVLGAISIAAQAISFLRNMGLKLDAAPAANRYSGQPGSVTATLGNPDGADWPSDLSSCLTSFGFDLKSLNARNHDPVTWIADPMPSSAATVQSEETRLDDRNSAQLQYQTGQDSDANCLNRTDFLLVQATVQRDEVKKLKDFLLKWFDGELDNLPGIVKDIVGPALEKLLGEIIDWVVKLVEPKAFRYIRIEHEACKPRPSPAVTATTGHGLDACVLVTRAEAQAVLGAPDPNPGPIAQPASVGAPGLVEGSACDHHTVLALALHSTPPHGDLEVVVGRFTDAKTAAAGAAQLVINLASATPPLTPTSVSGVGDVATLAAGHLPDSVGGGPAATIIVQRGNIVLWITVGLVDKGQEAVLPGEVKSLAITALSRIT